MAIHRITLENYKPNRLTKIEFDRIIKLSEQNISVKDICKTSFSVEYPNEYYLIVATICNLCLNLLFFLFTAGEISWELQKWFMPVYVVFIFWYGIGHGHATFDEFKHIQKQKLAYYQLIVPEVLQQKRHFDLAKLKVDIILEKFYLIPNDNPLKKHFDL
jgi:hypothetical protein